MGQLRTANKRQRRASIRDRASPLEGGRGAGAAIEWLAEASASPANDRDPVVVVDVANIPGGGQLHLLRCGTDYSIRFCADELMGSRDHLSEEALARLACEQVGPARGAVLIGGLGMGFTLGAALAAWGPDATITVAELVPEILTWARGPLAHLYGESLDDPRTVIAIGDVHDLIASQQDAFDAILLDVDNGPDGFMRPENDRLYCNWGLRAAHAALRPEGVLAVWSAYADASFGPRLAQIGFVVTEHKAASYSGVEADEYIIWLAVKPA